MRLLITFTLLIFGFTLTAQDFGIQKRRAKLEDVRLKGNSIEQKWFVTSFSSLSTSFVTSRAGSAMILAAPMGVQLNRTINNNVYAFAGVGITPAYIRLNPGFGSYANKGFSNSFMAANPSRFTVNPNAYIGMGYINDARTFEIQARVIVQQGNYYTNPSSFQNFYRLDKQMQGVPLSELQSSGRGLYSF